MVLAARAIGAQVASAVGASTFCTGLVCCADSLHTTRALPALMHSTRGLCLCLGHHVDSGG